MVTSNYFGKKKDVLSQIQNFTYHSASQIQSPLDVTFVTKEEVL